MPRRRLDVKQAQEAICTALKAHQTVRAACAYAGVDRACFYRWRDRDPAFRRQVAQAEGQSEVRLVSLILKAAQEGTWQAAAWLLERHPRTKADWRRGQQIAISQLSTPQLLEMLTEPEGRIESAGDAAAVDAETWPEDG